MFVRQPIIIHCFFGEMGSGKSFLARQFAEKNKIPFCEGDDFVPPEMSKAINLVLPPPEHIIADFVRKDLVQGIHRFWLNNHIKTKTGITYPHEFVVSQALYRNNHRAIISSALMKLGFDVRFYWVRTPIIQHARQLFSRRMGLGWLWYGLINRPFFQAPTHQHEVIWND